MTFQARGAMRNGMIAHLNADIAAAHLMGDGGGGAGAKEGVEDKIARRGKKIKNPFHESFGLLAFREYYLSLIMQVIR